MSATALTFFLFGTFTLANPQWLLRRVSGGHATPTAYHAFAYEEGFLRLRGPVVLAVMTAGLIIQAILLYHGQWRPWTRQAHTGYSLLVGAVLTWTIAAGPVFQAPPTDRSAKGAAAVKASDAQGRDR